MKIGSKAPRFALDGSLGEKVSLASLAGKYVVVYFYPRDSTPGCTREAHDFEAAAASFAERNTTVLGVSADSVASHCKFAAKEGLHFALLSDPDRSTIEKYEAWGEKVLYGKRSMGIIRSTVVIGPDGKVIAHFPKVKVDGHVAQVLAAIDAHRAG